MVRTGFAAGELKRLVARIERLEEEKKATTGDINEVYAEAKGQGFDTKIIRKVVKLRAMDAAERAQEAELIELYMDALATTPIEEAIKRAKPRARLAAAQPGAQ